MCKHKRSVISFHIWVSTRCPWLCVHTWVNKGRLWLRFTHKNKAPLIAFNAWVNKGGHDCVTWVIKGRSWLVTFHTWAKYVYECTTQCGVQCDAVTELNVGVQNGFPKSEACCFTLLIAKATFWLTQWLKFFTLSSFNRNMVKRYMPDPFDTRRYSSCLFVSLVDSCSLVGTVMRILLLSNGQNHINYAFGSLILSAGVAAYVYKHTTTSVLKLATNQQPVYWSLLRTHNQSTIACYEHTIGRLELATNTTSSIHTSCLFKSYAF